MVEPNLYAVNNHVTITDESETVIYTDICKLQVAKVNNIIIEDT